MIITQRGVDLIKSFEGCRLKAYLCPAGVWTIGYGHTRNVGTEPIHSSMVISQEKADSLLRQDLISYEKRVDKYDNIYHWTQNEFDALVSFSFNIGSIDQLTANGTRTKQTIADKIPLYNRAGGKILNGLTKRRQEEQKLFLTPVEKIFYTKGWNRDICGKWYADTEKTYYKSCWVDIDNHRYYFNSDGYALTNWHEIDGAWYYFEPTKDIDCEGALYVTDDNGKQSVGIFNKEV